MTNIRSRRKECHKNGKTIPAEIAVKPLSRKHLRQLMPLNHTALTARALASKGHKGSAKHMLGYSDPTRNANGRAPRMSALDGFYVVKPRRVVDSF